MSEKAKLTEEELMNVTGGKMSIKKDSTPGSNTTSDNTYTTQVEPDGVIVIE